MWSKWDKKAVDEKVSNCFKFCCCTERNQKTPRQEIWCLLSRVIFVCNSFPTLYNKPFPRRTYYCPHESHEKTLCLNQNSSLEIYHEIMCQELRQNWILTIWNYFKWVESLFISAVWKVHRNIVTEQMETWWLEFLLWLLLKPSLIYRHCRRNNKVKGWRLSLCL